MPKKQSIQPGTNLKRPRLVFKQEFTVTRKDHLGRKVTVNLTTGKKTVSNVKVKEDHGNKFGEPMIIADAVARKPQIASTSRNVPPIVPSRNDTFELEDDHEHSSILSQHHAQKMKRSQEWEEIRSDITRARIEEYAPATYTCIMCQEYFENIISCTECGPVSYFCEGCFTSHHAVMVPHYAVQWNSEFNVYEPLPSTMCLSTLLRPDHNCTSSRRDSIIVINERGRQYIQHYMYCSCEHQVITLVRYGLWPSTPVQPRTAFTYAYMLMMKKFVSDCAVPLTTFNTTIQRSIKVAAGVVANLDWLSSLNFMFVEHEVETLRTVCPDLLNGTQCPICPQIGDQDMRRYCLDGNMRLVHLRSKTAAVNRPLIFSKFFHCDQKDVDNFVNTKAKTVGNKNKEECSSFQAVTASRIKNKTEKLDVCGMFGSVCIHEFPYRFMDMRHGEKLAYSVYLISQAEHTDMIYYDIACLLDTYCKNRQIELTQKLAIPIFHAYGHKQFCQKTYSPRVIDGAGLTDGEAAERLWSYLGQFCYILKEMDPSNRADLTTQLLLNYGQRVFGNMWKTLVRRLERSQALIAVTSEKMDNMKYTEQQIMGWAQSDLKPMTSVAHNKGDWMEMYALHLQRYYSALDTADEGDTVEQAKKILEDTERQQNIGRWARHDDLYVQKLAQACCTERIKALDITYEAVSNYHLTRATMKKSRGQKTSSRLCQQMYKAMKKIQTALDAYNNIPLYGPQEPPHRLSKKEVMALEAPVWSFLSTGGSEGPSVLVKKMCIDLYHNNCRAKEEVINCRADINRLIATCSQQIGFVKTSLSHLCLTTLDRYGKAQMSVLRLHLQKLNIHQQAARSICKKLAHITSDAGDIYSMLDDVESFLVETSMFLVEDDHNQHDVVKQLSTLDEELIVDDDLDGDLTMSVDD